MHSRIDRSRQAAHEYLERIDLERDKALVLSFHENVTLERGATNRLEDLSAAVDGIRLGKRTALIDGLTYAFRELDAHRERPVLILLSDGEDTASFFRNPLFCKKSRTSQPRTYNALTSFQEPLVSLKIENTPPLYSCYALYLFSYYLTVMYY